MARNTRSSRRKGAESAENPNQGATGTASGSDGAANDLLDVAFRLAGERGWRNLALREVAKAAGISLAELYRRYPTKNALLAGFTARVDQTVLGDPVAGDAEPSTVEESARDRLFDLVMRRFDALAPYRPAVRSMLRDAPLDPLGSLCAGPRLLRAMGWMLEAAGIPSRGIAGLVRMQALAAVYLSTMRTWLGDESADMARTMAVLDRNLGRAGRCLRL